MEKESNCIAKCFLYLTTGIIALMGTIYLIGIISFTCKNDNYWGLLVTLSIVGFLLLTFSICSLIHYHFREDATKKIETIWDKVGYDITRLLSWFFSVNGFLFIILCTIVALVCFFIYRFWGICGCHLGNNNSELQLTALTLSITLATIIPAIITKVITKSEIESITESKLNAKLEKLYASLRVIRKDKAHASRMSAVLLYQIATQQDDVIINKIIKKEEINNPSLINEQNKEHLIIAIKNLSWSIGWASSAITQYILTKEDTIINKFCNEILENYIKPSIYYLGKCIENLGKNELTELLKKEDTNNNPQILRKRDLESIIIMHAMILHYNLAKNYYTDLKIIEKLYIDNNNNIAPFTINIHYPELDTEVNNKIKKIADDIIAELEKIKNRYS